MTFSFSFSLFVSSGDPPSILKTYTILVSTEGNIQNHIDISSSLSIGDVDVPTTIVIEDNAKKLTFQNSNGAELFIYTYIPSTGVGNEQSQSVTFPAASPSSPFTIMSDPFILKYSMHSNYLFAPNPTFLTPNDTNSPPTMTISEINNIDPVFGTGNIEFQVQIEDVTITDANIILRSETAGSLQHYAFVANDQTTSASDVSGITIQYLPHLEDDAFEPYSTTDEINSLAISSLQADITYTTDSVRQLSTVMNDGGNIILTTTITQETIPVKFKLPHEFTLTGRSEIELYTFAITIQPIYGTLVQKTDVNGTDVNGVYTYTHLGNSMLPDTFSYTAHTHNGTILDTTGQVTMPITDMKNFLPDTSETLSTTLLNELSRTLPLISSPTAPNTGTYFTYKLVDTDSNPEDNEVRTHVGSTQIVTNTDGSQYIQFNVNNTGQHSYEIKVYRFESSIQQQSLTADNYVDASSNGNFKSMHFKVNVLTSSKKPTVQPQGDYSSYYTRRKSDRYFLLGEKYFGLFKTTQDTTQQYEHMIDTLEALITSRNLYKYSQVTKNLLQTVAPIGQTYRDDVSVPDPSKKRMTYLLSQL